MTSGSQTGLASDISSCHHTSRPSCIVMGILFPTRLTTIQVLTCTPCFPASLIASSAFFLIAMGFEPLYPPSVVIRILQEESTIRSDNAVGENPPNTIEWTAPNLAQANMATANSITIGIYIETRSPFLTP